MGWIDSHVHLWRYDPSNQFLNWTAGQPMLQQDHLLSELEPHFERYGVNGIIAVQAQEHTDETNWLLDVAAADSRVRGVTGWCDPAAPNFIKQLLTILRPKLVALRNVAQGKPPGYLIRPEFIRGVRDCADAGVIFELLIFADQIAEAAALVDRCPETRFVLDHIAKPKIKDQIVRPWMQDLQRLAAHENVVGVKLSGMVTEACITQRAFSFFEPYIEHVFRIFGVDRVMFGSDHPVCRVWGDYGETIELVLRCLDRFEDPTVKPKVLGGNAVRIYRL